MLSCLIQLDANEYLWASMASHGEKVMKTRKIFFLTHTLQTQIGFF